MQQSSSFSFKELLSRKNSPQSVFELGFDVNARDSVGQTLLIAATLQNNQIGPVWAKLQFHDI